MRGVTILGSTGSIGVNTLDVISRQPDRFHVVALTAHRNDALLAEQCRQWRPRFAVMVDEEAAERLQQRLEGSDVEVLSGREALTTVAALDEVRVVMAAIVGAAGLLPTLAAANSGKRVLLANKEALVMSGQILIDAARANGAELLPIDSEHNAIFQCMPSADGCADLDVKICVDVKALTSMSMSKATPTSTSSIRRRDIDGRRSTSTSTSTATSTSTSTSIAGHS